MFDRILSDIYSDRHLTQMNNNRSNYQRIVNFETNMDEFHSTNEVKYKHQYFPNTDEDWDQEIEGNQSKIYEKKSPSFNSNYMNENSNVRSIIREFVINVKDRPRLIGKGGTNIKQIEQENNVKIDISKDRQCQLVDVIIFGSNEQNISSTINYIKCRIGDIKEKNAQSQLKPTHTSYLNDRNANQNTSHHSKIDNSSTYQQKLPSFQNDTNYKATFNSNEYLANNKTFVSNKYNSNSMFTSMTSCNTNSNETTKRVDWAKMRLIDTANDMTKWKDFPPIIKRFYDELSDISQMSPEDIQALRAEKNNIVVSWFDESLKTDYENKSNCKLKIPNPIYEFAHAFHNYPDIMTEIIQQNFIEPTPIQCQAWPIALSGLDFIGIAQTGTGKTLAFLLPALIHIDNQPQTRQHFQGPKALILSPTRELAIQIHQEVQKYNYRGIRSAVIYGGSSRKNQIYQCETGVEIIIATPGRLNDLVMNNVIDLRSVTFLVLDEADRMLDMGFEPQIVKILLDIRPDRQTIMTSATWPEDVRRVAARYMRNPIQIYVGTLDLTAVHSVRQDVVVVKEEEKFDMLLDFIAQMSPDDKIIVFVDRKSTADVISSELIRKYISCQSIHGDREQSDREQALEDLKLGNVNILIATDVASRGLDIQDITVVFNYDLPKSMEDYVHRVGRTGRAGRTGYAISLVTRENWGNASRLIKILEEAGQNVPAELQEMAERFKEMQERKRSLGSGSRNRNDNRSNNDGYGRFFGLPSNSLQNSKREHRHEKMPPMNSTWTFSS